MGSTCMKYLRNKCKSDVLDPKLPSYPVLSSWKTIQGTMQGLAVAIFPLRVSSVLLIRSDLLSRCLSSGTRHRGVTI